jgi:hypothetical protein
MWVSSGRTESGDDLMPVIWSRKPSPEEVDAAYADLYPDEQEVGGVDWMLNPVEVRA